MKKKIILTTTLIIISSLIILLTYKKENNVTFSNEIKNSNNILSIMLETSSGSGDYQESSSNSFPTTGYILNENLSNCENGSKISWNEENKSVLVKSNKADKCYLYFDVYEPTLAEAIINLYTGTQGENNIYYHDSNLTNGANDNSYRYAGSDPNNYVCFGSDESTCPENNLYRIIGVFNNQIKLIKYDYATNVLLGTDGDYNDIYSSSNIGAYYWNYRNDPTNYNHGVNTWETSLLNRRNLNINFINNIGSKWAEMIDTTTWKVGGNKNSNIFDSIASITYQNEIINPASSTSYNAKIGLMYASDYGFSAPPSAWTTNLSEYNDYSITSENWIYMKLSEWTITRDSSSINMIISINEDGAVKFFNTYSGYAIRPTFYLNNSVIKTSGDGTKTNPYRISN